MSKTALWTVIAIVIIELTAHIALRQTVAGSQGSALHRYFEYGRSIEGKIVRRVGQDDVQSHPLARAGWFRKRQQIDDPAARDHSKTRVLVYGMSFSNLVADELENLGGDELLVQRFAGPSAPLSHSYAYIEKHRPYSRGDIVILGILASSLPRINSLTHMTANFEQPGAHFYPRYKLDDSEQLEKFEIEIFSLQELREALGDEARWRQIKSEVGKNDAYYDALIFEKSLLDESVFARLLKRAWGQRSLNETDRQFHDENGFKNTENTLEVSKALVRDFARSVRLDGAQPFVILFNDRGFDDHLFQVLAPVLNSEAIPYFSTHRQFPASDRSNFVPDGHFRPEIDRRIALSVFGEIRTMINAAGRVQTTN